jgi:hypothetical protein
MTPVSYGAVSLPISRLIIVGCWIAVNMNAAAGRVGGRRKGDLLIGCGRVLLSPDPIPYLFSDRDALQHPIYFLSLGILPAGM